MKLKIPFTDKFIVLGKKSVEAAKQSFSYGALMNTFDQMLQGDGYRIGFDTLYLIYNNVVDVKMAIRKIQDAVMRNFWRFTAAGNERKEGDAAQVKYAESLLERKEMSMARLKDIWVRDLDVAGNAYWQLLKSVGGQPLGLKPIDPRTMTVVSDKYGNPLYYLQSVNGFNPVRFEKDEIIHSVRDYSTANPVLGVSPIESFVWEARTEMASQMSNYYFFENNAVPAHLLIMDENLTEDQLKTVESDMQRNFRGPKNKNKHGMIPFLKDIKTIAMSQKDMQFIETRQFTTKKIVVAFGVDSFLLGYTEGVQRSNAYVIRKEFYENTVRSYEIQFEDLINNFVLPAWGINNIKFRINLSKYEDAENLENRTRSDVMAGIMTINEARQIRNLDPSDNQLADELMYNGIILDDLGNEMLGLKTLIKQRLADEKSKVFNLLEDNANI